MATRPVDEWTLESPTAYSPAKFYTTGGKNAIPVGAKVSADMLHRMTVMVQSGEYPPYSTVSDIIRDALHHLLMLREGAKPETDLALRRVRALQAIADEEFRNMAHDESNKRIADIINLWMQRENRDRARKFFIAALDEIEGIDDAFWKGWHLEQLQKRLGEAWKWLFESVQ